MILSPSFPVDWFICLDAPPVPADDADDKELGAFLILLSAAHLDCKAQLAATGKGMTN